ncbi:autotransporter outer membrane beta-barrel domain-containing protein, partial [Anaerovibrio lipolyticus]|uniref:autotransporter outer membrane beta-barrel domain-containing protein n=1 Tax=Anaerovibrio lipolyticus TaxID=82374 RepID=UPI0026F0D4A5
MNKRKQISRKKMYVLSAALLAGSVSMAPIASAADSPYIASEEITFGDNVFAEINFLKEGKGIGRGQNDKDYIVDKAVYTLPKKLIQGTLDSTVYWSDILGAGAKNTTPWQIFVNTDNDQNAGATSHAIESDGVAQATNSYNHAANYIGEQIQDGVVLSTITYDNAKTGVLPKGNYGLSEITIGNYMGANRKDAIHGWWIDTDTVLPTNEQATDFVGTIRHELGHALGISLRRGTTSAGAPCINDSITDTNSWTLHLYDQNGNQAKAGKPIVTSSDIGSGDASQYFVVDKDITPDGRGYAYFMGDNVTDALGGATFFGRSGLPVNGWEDSKFEGSHLQTAGMMSHRPYSNYTSFMEVELAVMQDLGYSIDRKAFFGRSIYGNGGTIDNTQGFFARNEAGTAYLDNTYSTVPLGIGLHIYGSENLVTQSANILTKGVGGTGIRVDGTENTLVIPAATEIHADGTRGNGILVAYGRNQTVNQAGTVTANGDGGTGVRFDFGSSTNGATDEYRGSYIRYQRKVSKATSAEADDGGEITSAENLDITDMNANTYNANAQELNGPQVLNYNLSGTLSGADNAIYISKNAFVKNININSGAAITGNITSDWKQFGADECEGAYGKVRSLTRLTIQYNGKRGTDGYLYSNYIPDLVTNLNINTDLNYAGNITGEDNMKLNITSGTFKYSGSADVVNVTVAKDAALFGGYFKVNDMSDHIDQEDGFTDTTTGKFYNHGTIGPNSANEDLEITGNLESDGTLYAYAGGSKGSIVVSENIDGDTVTGGKANIDGSTVTAKNALPGESISVLSAKSINGTITNTKDNPHVETGMLNTYGVVGSDNVTVHTVAANNLGDITSDQLETYDAMKHMVEHLSATGDSRVNEMRTLYNLDNKEAKEALTALSSSPVP